MATEANGDVVMFGGTLAFNPTAVVTDQTWVWDGTNWSQQTLSTRPDPRTTARMARDRNGKLVLFGGFILNGGTPFNYGDTWLWDGSTWSQAAPAVSPPARGSAAMAMDKNGNVVMYGGFGASGAMSDTWLWDGSNWTQVSPANSPGPRGNASLAMDKNGDLVLFGGSDNFGALRGDTWLWDGSNWTLAAPATSPASRRDYALATDAQGDVVLFGGVGLPFQLVDDTWLWNGSTWTDVSPDSGPEARQWAMSATDKSGAVFLFGGMGSSGPESDSWLLTVVADTTPPVVNVPSDITTDATGPGGASVVFDVSASDPDDAASTPTCVPVSGSLFPIGTTIVNCSSTDTHGNTGTGHFSVHVKGAAEQLADLAIAVKGVGPGTSLADKVKLIQGHVAANKRADACDGLTGFISEVRAQIGKKLTRAQAASFAAQANNIEATLGC